MSEKKTVELSAEVKAEYQKVDASVQEAVLSLGALEMDYVTRKNGLLMEVERRVKARLDLVVKAAKDANLDVDNTKWVLDVKTMQLVES